MIEYYFPPAPIYSVVVKDSKRRYPVNRIFCVGQNYADHVKEMGSTSNKKQPIYFTKPTSAICESNSVIDYPPGTENLHYEMELVVMLDRAVFQANEQEAKKAIFGFACGLDLTRRDLQKQAKEKGHPWDLSKAFENSAVISQINREIRLSELADKILELKLNGETHQHSELGKMIWPIEELISILSHYYHLQAGDIIYTGTPAGVGAISPGDRIDGTIQGVGEIALDIRK